MAEPLFPYQEVGARWLASKRHAFLADQQRVGKTAQAIRACDLVGAERILVLCPAIARMNWGREFTRFSICVHEQFVCLTKQDFLIWPLPSMSICICSYDLAVASTIRSKIGSITWDVVILDEAHYCKNRQAQRTKFAYGCRSRFWWRLSGTPAPNHAGELYPHLKSAGLYQAGYWDFVETYCKTVVTQFGTQITGSKNIPQLKKLIAPFFLRRLLTDVAPELPPMLYSDVVVEPSPVDMNLWYPSVALKIETAEDILSQVEKENQSIATILNLTGRGETGSETLAALQGAKTLQSRKYVALQKIPAICELITSELLSKAYTKLVIFAWHRDAIRFLHLKLRQFNPVIIYGGTPAIQRDHIIKKFRDYGKIQIFIGNIQASGVAVDLSVAHEVAFVEASWVPGENAQAAMRVHHLKQKEPVRVRFFSLADSVDERVQSILRRKTRDLTALFDEPEKESEPVLTNPFE